MVSKVDGVYVYHPYEPPEKGEPLTVKTEHFTLVNVDVMLERGGWKVGDIDFVVSADLKECPVCHAQVCVGFGQKMMVPQFTQRQLKDMVLQGKVEGKAFIVRRKTVIEE
jgi:hypothetical protein